MMEIKIRAFGACMIGGFPHRQEDSFFHQAVERLRPTTPHHIADSMFTMGGFPITRVPKHFQARCLSAKPHIVVLQFGSSDLIVPVRRHHHRSGRPIHTDVSTHLPTAFDRLKWSLRSAAGDILNLHSVTSPEIYLATLLQLVQTSLEHQAIPVVMSPFVFGWRRSNRVAGAAVGQLEKMLADFPEAIFVNAYAELDRHPRNEILLSDGTHLSLAGQSVVADALYSSLKKVIENSARLNGPVAGNA
jgi:lysophospholipase L1-like esterase